MKKILLKISLPIAFIVALSSCEEKSMEEKQNKIVENKLENAAMRSEIKADSLKRLAESYEERADELKKAAKEIE